MFRYRIAAPGSTSIESWFRLRTDEYLEHGLITAADIDATTGLYTDQYDEHSIHVLASNEDGIDVGCVRMVESGGDRVLPVSDLFEIDVLPRSWELSANLVLPEYRKSALKPGLYRAVFSLAEEKGYQNMYGIVEPPYLDSLIRTTGAPIEVVSEPQFVFNALNVVILVPRHLMAAVIETPAVEADGFAAQFGAPIRWVRTSGSDFEAARGTGR
jgi:N-acyl-L-homoserine lactone synthetase